MLPIYIKSCNDELFHVRKVSATHAPDIGRVIGKEETELHIVPHFAKLAEDVVWGVRKENLKNIFIHDINYSAEQYYLKYKKCGSLFNETFFYKEFNFRSLKVFDIILA